MAFLPPPAAPTITKLNSDLPLPMGEQMVVDFDHPNAPGFGFSGGYVRSGSLGLDPGVSAPPPGDLTNYMTLTAGQTGIFTSIRTLKTFSFFLGSPDSYNSVEFLGPNGFNWKLVGDQIWGGGGGADGDQSIGRRIDYNFGGYGVNEVRFFSSGNSFEFDSLAAGAVPEPASWAMMILGFLEAGGAIRVARRRRGLPV